VFKDSPATWIIVGDEDEINLAEDIADRGFDRARAGAQAADPHRTEIVRRAGT